MLKNSRVGDKALGEVDWKWLEERVGGLPELLSEPLEQ